MKKKKQMSKNELCSYIHALTGKSYKETRKICKKAKWNKERAVRIAIMNERCFSEFCGELDDKLQEIINVLEKSLTPAFEAATAAARELKKSLIKSFPPEPLNGNEIIKQINDVINEGGKA